MERATKRTEEQIQWDEELEESNIATRIINNYYRVYTVVCTAVQLPGLAVCCAVAISNQPRPFNWQFYHSQTLESHCLSHC